MLEKLVKNFVWNSLDEERFIGLDRRSGRPEMSPV